MPQRLKNYQTAESFIKSLETKTKSCFESPTFRAEAFRENDKTNHREFKLKFFYAKDGQWIPFGHVISQFRKDLVDAFKEELRIYSPVN